MLRIQVLHQKNPLQKLEKAIETDSQQYDFENQNCKILFFFFFKVVLPSMQFSFLHDLFLWEIEALLKLDDQYARKMFDPKDRFPISQQPRHMLRLLFQLSNTCVQ